MSQTQHVLDHLRLGGTLTPQQALNLYGCFRLAARIADAKELLRPGEEIVTRRLKTPGGAVVAEYVLVKTEIVTWNWP